MTDGDGWRLVLDGVLARRNGAMQQWYHDSHILLPPYSSLFHNGSVGHVSTAHDLYGRISFRLASLFVTTSWARCTDGFWCIETIHPILKCPRVSLRLLLSRASFSLPAATSLSLRSWFRKALPTRHGPWKSARSTEQVQMKRAKHCRAMEDSSCEFGQIVLLPISSSVASTLPSPFQSHGLLRTEWPLEVWTKGGLSLSCRLRTSQMLRRWPGIIKGRQIPIKILLLLVTLL